MRIIPLALALITLATSAGAANNVAIVDTVCLHKATINKYMDIIASKNASEKVIEHELAKDVAAGECIEFPKTTLPIDERGEQHAPYQGADGKTIILEPVRIRKYWGINPILVTDV